VEAGFSSKRFFKLKAGLQGLLRKEQPFFCASVRTVQQAAISIIHQRISNYQYLMTDAA
jgi:hypothetical protein